VIATERLLSLGLLACSGCSLFVEESPRFSADTGSTDDTDGSSSEDSSTDSEGIPDSEPPQPTWLTVHVSGNPDDADVAPRGPGLLLDGGGVQVDTAYEWQAEQIAGGDIVVLRSKDDPLAPVFSTYLYETIGGADSVVTVIVPPGAASFDPWITWTVATAEAVLIVGDDPYGLMWKGTPIETAIMHAWNRKAVIGGVDAGLSVLGEFVFPAYEGPLTSSEALADPYSSKLVLDDDYLSFWPLDQALIEPRFASADHMGRLLAFAARVLQLEDGLSSTFVGIGVDENTAMVIDTNDVGTVHGEGNVYVFRTQWLLETVCVPQQQLEFGPVTVYKLADGETATWPGGQPQIGGTQVTAMGGVAVPALY
jgi:hypothetical protein